MALRWGGREENLWWRKNLRPLELLSQNGTEVQPPEMGMDNGAGTRLQPSPSPVIRGIPNAPPKVTEIVTPTSQVLVNNSRRLRVAAWVGPSPRPARLFLKWYDGSQR